MSRKRMDAVEREALARRTIGRPDSRPDTRLDEALPTPAGLLLQLQQRAGNRAVGGLLRARRPTVGRLGETTGRLQRAGDPEGLMKEHHASGFTYHHIIPENKLQSFWEMLSEHGHLSLVQSGLKSVTTRGLAQFDEAALSNLKLDLTKEIKEVVGTWDESKFKEVVAAGKGGGTSAALVDKFFPGLSEPSHEYHGSYRRLIDIFNKRFKLTAETSTSAITATVSAEGADYLADEKAKMGVHQILMWMPGNIHRGPSARFTPKDKAHFNKELDDGGDEFEEAAKLIISAEQFQTVSALNDAIDTYLKTPTHTEVLATVSSLLDKMKGYSVKDYDESQWEKVTLGSKRNQKTAWRFKNK